MASPTPFFKPPPDMLFKVRPGVDMSGVNPKLRGLLEALANSKVVDQFEITSGFRDPARNAAVGGAKGSRHTQGTAADISTKGWTDDQRSAFLKAAINSGAKGVGIYPNGSFHFDIRDTPAAWGVGGSYRSSPIDQFPSWAQPHLNTLLGGKGGALPPSIMSQGKPVDVPQLPASTGPAFGISGPLSQPVTPTAPTTPAAETSLADNKDVTGGLDMLAKAFKGGSGGQQQQQEQMAPMSNYSAEQAARASSAQALMAQLLAKQKMPRGILG